jgi:hypothetical protein
LIVILVMVLGQQLASAHVGPSPRTNNRYLKVTILDGRIRLLYTYFVGELPGRQVRARLDTDGDGTLSAAEARVFGNELGAQVADDLHVQLDGAPQALTWSSVDVGLGTPAVLAGALSVDLVAWVCLDRSPQGNHQLQLADRWRLPDPGESELMVEAGPTVQVSALTGDHVLDHKLHGVQGHHYRWPNGPGPLGGAGLTIHYHVTSSGRDRTAPCPPGSPIRLGGTAPHRPAWPYAVLAGLALALLLALWRARPASEGKPPRPY